MKLSIIVPIYNIEQYLFRCIESISNAICGDVEVLLVDDGSTDLSSKIAKDYASRNERFLYYKKDNGGLSDARNYGINNATGDYIWFVDGDDYIPPNSVSIIQKACLSNPECDLLCFSAKKMVNDNCSIIKYSAIGKIDGPTFLKYQYLHKTMHPEVWHNIFKKELVLNHGCFFKKGIYHEDEEWTPKIFSLSSCVFYSDECIYCYDIRPNSIMTSNQYLKRMNDLYNMAKYYSEYEIKNKKLVTDRIISLFLSVFGQSCNPTLYKKSKGDYCFFVKNVFFLKTKIKVIIFCISKKMFFKICKINTRRNRCA